MKIAILGFNVEGRASYDYYLSQGHELVIHDRSTETEIPEGVEAVLGDSYLDNLDQYDLLIRSPGLYPNDILAKNPSVKDKITTQTIEFLRVSPTKNIIGVTGTKGKGTTSTIIHSLLQACGKDVFLGGNIGTPPLNFLSELGADSWVVLELSNFQLIDLLSSPHIALCLTVTPEHIDWHTDFEDYMKAKSQLFAHQSPDDIAIYFAENDNSKNIASSGQGQTIPYLASPGAIIDNDAITIDGQEIIKTSDLKLIGKHNWQNICAAVTAVWQVSQDVDAMHQALANFEMLEHRLELVRTFNGVNFYNDSYSSGLVSTKAAIEAIHEKKVMILGGHDRMFDIDHFGPYALDYADEIRTLLLIGASAKRLAETLDKAGFDNYVLFDETKDINEIVSKALELAEEGDAVILSPGFASFDMFKNFEDRGIKYKAAVNAL